MFYRSLTLDKGTEDGIRAIESVYKQLQDVLSKIPEGRSRVFAETYLQQSYMWAISCIEESAASAPAAPVAPPAAPVAPPAAPAAPVAPAPIIPNFELPPEVVKLIPPQAPQAPISDSDILSKSSKELDDLMMGIKDLTSKVRASGLPL